MSNQGCESDVLRIEIITFDISTRLAENFSANMALL
jgi:hypothetical protein